MDSAARTAIHMGHRLGALITTVVMILLIMKLRTTEYPLSRIWAGRLTLILIVQLLLGISNVVFALPLAVAVLHNAVGALLLVKLAALNYLIRTGLANASN